MSSTDLPEAASRRLSESSFSSGLTVPDFAACLAMGLQPVGLVQGFCAMQSAWTNSVFRTAGFPMQTTHVGYVETYQCPHGVMMGGEHRAYGQNYELTQLEDAWTTGYQTALSRMVEEATALGAHGVVGVVDAETELTDTGVVEYHVRGTAVVVRDASPPHAVWTTALAGQRLAKAFEAGYAPVTAVAATVSVRMWGGCITMYQLEGTTLVMTGGPSEIQQVVEAKTAARRVARERIRAELGHDDLHGVTWQENDRDVGQATIDFHIAVRGSRLRRAGDVAPLAAPELLRVLA